MSITKTVVLNGTQVNQKIDRLAFQIHENHYNEKEIILAGIAGNGFKLAELLKQRLANFSDVKVVLVTVQVNKEEALPLLLMKLENLLKELLKQQKKLQV